MGHSARISDTSIDAEWDSFLTDTPNAHHAQTSRWGRLKASANGDAVRVIVERNGSIVGGAQMLLRRLPVVGVVGYVPKGPVVAEHDSELADAILEALCRTARQHDVRYLLVQPPEYADQITEQMQAHEFAPTPLAVQPTATVKIDLAVDTSQLFAGMKKHARREIRRGLVEGFVVREGSEDDLPTFYRLLSATAVRQGFTPFSFAYFRSLWQLLEPLGWAKLFIVQRGDEPVSAQIVIPFSDTVIKKSIGWSGKYSHFGPNKVMDWVTMQWAKQAGYRYYDLEGIDPALARMVLDGTGIVTPEYGRSYHKLNYGGDIVLLPGGYDYLPNPVLRWADHLVVRHFASSRFLDRVTTRLRNQ